MAAISRPMLLKRWLRDWSADGLEYVPEEMAPRARSVAGFELRGDGTYTEIESGPDDRPGEGEGSWELSADDVLTLRPRGTSRSARRIRLIEASESRIVSEAVSDEPESSS